MTIKIFQNLNHSIVNFFQILCSYYLIDKNNSLEISKPMKFLDLSL